MLLARRGSLNGTTADPRAGTLTSEVPSLPRDATARTATLSAIWIESRFSTRPPATLMRTAETPRRYTSTTFGEARHRHRLRRRMPPGVSPRSGERASQHHGIATKQQRLGDAAVSPDATIGDERYALVDTWAACTNASTWGTPKLVVSRVVQPPPALRRLHGIDAAFDRVRPRHRPRDAVRSSNSAKRAAES